MAMGTGGYRFSGNGRKKPGHAEVDRPPDHVVVFVHGMGKALKGGTLQEWSQPLMQSLYDLSVDLAGDHEDPPLIIDKAHAVGDAPEVWIRVLRGCKGDRRPDYVRILFTEASWGSDFTPATATSTYWWAFATAWLVFDRSLELVGWNLYPGERNRRSLKWIAKRALQVGIYALVAALGMILLIGALVVLLVLVILAQVPGARRWLGKLVTLFADFLGDPQVWKRKPLQAAAMRQRVSDTLVRWDHASGVDVTVVAHSQGAAITGQLLFQNKDRARATNFVSVGSGLSLLGYAEWGGRSEDPVADWLANARPTRWINVWGKFDFVPAGPIGTKALGDDPVFKKIFDRKSAGNGGPGPEEHPVYNRSALIKDHIVYSKNRIEVIDPIAALILLPARPEGTIQFGPDPDDKRLRPHRVMVKSLVVTRLLAAISGALSAPAILSWLWSLGWARTLVQCGPPDAGEDPWWSSWLCSGRRYSWSLTPSADWWVLGLTSLVLAAVLIGILNGPVWGVLHGLVERRRRPPRRRIDARVARLRALLERLRGRQVTENTDQRVGAPSSHPWVKVIVYLITVAILAVVVPVVLIGPDLIWIFIYALSASLWAACFAGTGITPLEARFTDDRPAKRARDFRDLLAVPPHRADGTHAGSRPTA
ncbi:hypothetical protein ASG92_15675 [Arthrobacter sp. Soil736]|uniref:hypothetical protein n=1 Tax=Arthrobacter sp. Soil736 TaxID=1736395 RepID=UPI0006F3E0DD|nr:hypothetical protein [Arthrobacter sp. Soil736]KRE66747.1 hypothetical protein ASG92_15675 [Arthrobacter sp. Soil736]